MHDATVPERPSGVRWQVFALACGCSFLLYVHRYSWTIVLDPLQKEYGFDNTFAGVVFAAFYVTYAVGQIPSGILVDRFGPHRFLSAIALLWSLFLAGFGLTGSAIALIALRALFGAAQAGCYPALTKVTRAWFPLRSRTTIQGWVATTFGRAGAAMSPIILGTLLIGTLGLSWQFALMVLAAAGLAFAAAFWILFRNSPEENPAVNALELSIIRGGQIEAIPQTGVLPWGRAFHNRSMRWFVVQQYLDAGSDVVFLMLIGKYFLQVHDLDILRTGLLASLPFWGGAAGGVVGGWLNDHLIASTGSRRWSRSLVGAVGKIIGCGFLLWLSALSNPLAAGLALAAAKFFSDWSQPTTWGTCTDLGGRFSATVFSIINTAGTLGGVIMPLVFGLLLDVFTTSQTVADKVVSTTNWSPLFYLIAAMYLVSGLCWLLVDCTKTLDRPEETPAAALQ